jgi:2'-5' RNA ligase
MSAEVDAAIEEMKRAMDDEEAAILAAADRWLASEGKAAGADLKKVTAIPIKLSLVSEIPPSEWDKYDMAEAEDQVSDLLRYRVTISPSGIVFRGSDLTGRPIGHVEMRRRRPVAMINDTELPSLVEAPEFEEEPEVPSNAGEGEVVYMAAQSWLVKAGEPFEEVGNYSDEDSEVEAPIYRVHDATNLLDHPDLVGGESGVMTYSLKTGNVHFAGRGAEYHPPVIYSLPVEDGEDEDDFVRLRIERGKVQAFQDEAGAGKDPLKNIYRAFDKLHSLGLSADTPTTIFSSSAPFGPRQKIEGTLKVSSGEMAKSLFTHQELKALGAAIAAAPWSFGKLTIDRASVKEVVRKDLAGDSLQVKFKRGQPLDLTFPASNDFLTWWYAGADAGTWKRNTWYHSHGDTFTRKLEGFTAFVIFDPDGTNWRVSVVGKSGEEVDAREGFDTINAAEDWADFQLNRLAGVGNEGYVEPGLADKWEWADYQLAAQADLIKAHSLYADPGTHPESPSLDRKRWPARRKPQEQFEVTRLPDAALEDGEHVARVTVQVDYIEAVSGERIKAPYDTLVKYVAAQGRVIKIEPPDVRQIARDIDADVVAEVGWPTAYQLEQAFARAATVGKAAYDEEGNPDTSEVEHWGNNSRRDIARDALFNEGLSGRTVLRTREGDRTVGVAEMCDSDDPEELNLPPGKYMCLNNFATAESGRGRALFAAVLARAKEAGAGLWLFSPVAGGFYRHLGMHQSDTYSTVHYLTPEEVQSAAGVEKLIGGRMRPNGSQVYQWMMANKQGHDAQELAEFAIKHFLADGLDQSDHDWVDLLAAKALRKVVGQRGPQWNAVLQPLLDASREWLGKYSDEATEKMPENEDGSINGLVEEDWARGVEEFVKRPGDRTLGLAREGLQEMVAFMSDPGYSRMYGGAEGLTEWERVALVDARKLLHRLYSLTGDPRIVQAAGIRGIDKALKELWAAHDWLDKGGPPQNDPADAGKVKPIRPVKILTDRDLRVLVNGIVHGTPLQAVTRVGLMAAAHLVVNALIATHGPFDPDHEAGLIERVAEILSELGAEDPHQRAVKAAGSWLGKTVAMLEAGTYPYLDKASEDADVDAKNGEAPAEKVDPTEGGVFIGLDVPDDVAVDLLGKVKGALPEGAELEPADKLHVTMVYLGESAEKVAADMGDVESALVKFAAGQAPVKCRVGGLGVFEQDEQRVLYAQFDCAGLQEMRHDLVEALEATGEVTLPDQKRYGYTPHVTLSYMPADAGLPDVRLVTDEFTIDTLDLWVGNERTKYKLGGADEGDQHE